MYIFEWQSTVFNSSDNAIRMLWYENQTILLGRQGSSVDGMDLSWLCMPHNDRGYLTHIPTHQWHLVHQLKRWVMIHSDFFLCCKFSADMSYLYHRKLSSSGWVGDLEYLQKCALVEHWFWMVSYSLTSCFLRKTADRPLKWHSVLSYCKEFGPIYVLLTCQTGFTASTQWKHQINGAVSMLEIGEMLVWCCVVSSEVALPRLHHYLFITSFDWGPNCRAYA